MVVVSAEAFATAARVYSALRRGGVLLVLVDWYLLQRQDIVFEHKLAYTRCVLRVIAVNHLLLTLKFTFSNL